MSGQCQGARGVAAAIGRNMANKSNITFLVNCYDFANLREALIPLANGNTVGGHRHLGLLRIGEHTSRGWPPAARRGSALLSDQPAGVSNGPLLPRPFVAIKQRRTFFLTRAGSVRKPSRNQCYGLPWGS